MNKRKIGNEKEILAVNELSSNGYTILEKNYSCRHGEIDIIGLDKNCICFVEVKYRSTAMSGLPEEAVSINKMKKICKTSQFYLYSHKEYLNYQMRYDVVAILGNDIKIYKNAFFYVGKNAF